jgi:uncharacterized membrane protein (DUF106 family)
MLFTIFEITFKEIITTPPGSMFFVLILALLTGLISSLLTKWLVDTEEIERKQKQIKKHGEDKEKIIELAEHDVNRYIKERKKWERKDQILKKTQQRMSLQRLKPTCITFVPMIVIFTLVRILLTNDPIALSPMNANDIPFIGNLIAAGNTIWINFTAWYFLCSLGISTLIQRVLKIQTQASGGMGQAFGGSKAKALEFPEI